MTWRHIEGAEAQIHSFLNLAVYGGKWSTSQLSCFIPREKPPGTHSRRVQTGLRIGPDILENRKIPCHCLELNLRPSSPWQNHYSDYNTQVKNSVHMIWYVVPDKIPYRLQEGKKKTVSILYSSSTADVPVWKWIWSSYRMRIKIH